MVQKAYNNPINEMEVSIAIERLLIANFPASSWINTPGRIDLDQLPSGYADLGAVVEDSPSFKVNRDIFQLNTGIPAVTQYQAVIGMTGTFEAMLHSNSWRKVQTALGNYTYSTTVTTIGSVSSVVNQAQFVLTYSGTINNATIGRQIVIANPGTQDNIDAVESWIASMTTLTTSTFLIQLGTTPIKTPIGGNVVYTYNLSRLLVGAAPIKSYTLIGVADFIDDTQIVHYMSKVQPQGEFMEEIKPGENKRTKVAFTAFGRNAAAPDGSNQLICAERYYFPKGTAAGSW